MSNIDHNVCFYISATQSEFVGMEVEYVTLPGWKTSTADVRQFADLPPNAQAYVKKIEELLQVPGKHTILCYLFF